VLLVAQSKSAEDIKGALLTLVVTNAALCITTLSLAFSNQLTLFDGLLVFNLLSLSLPQAIVCLGKYTIAVNPQKRVIFTAILSFFLISVTEVFIWAVAPRFGAMTECNKNLRFVFFFHKFPALGGIRIGMLFLTSSGILGTVFFALLTWVLAALRKRHGAINDVNSDYQVYHTAGMFFILSFCIFTTAYGIAIGELYVHWNDPIGIDQWGFGQILPMLLIILPLEQVITSFLEGGK